ncbi:hypothetical protein L584_13630 [Pantoea agglomerans Tx10]|nr:hypothetical protein L584_13630 [Pantoea agglomerans Tx10]
MLQCMVRPALVSIRLSEKDNASGGVNCHAAFVTAHTLIIPPFWLQIRKNNQQDNPHLSAAARNRRQRKE